LWRRKALTKTKKSPAGKRSNGLKNSVGTGGKGGATEQGHRWAKKVRPKMCERPRDGPRRMEQKRTKGPPDLGKGKRDPHEDKRRTRKIKCFNTKLPAETTDRPCGKVDGQAVGWVTKRGRGRGERALITHKSFFDKKTRGGKPTKELAQKTRWAKKCTTTQGEKDGLKIRKPKRKEAEKKK